jgi:hypothetical protein
MTEKEFARLPAARRDFFHSVGILPEEVMLDPEHGELLNVTGVRKLAARAPNQDRAERFIDSLDNHILPQLNAKGR